MNRQDVEPGRCHRCDGPTRRWTLSFCDGCIVLERRDWNHLSTTVEPKTLTAIRELYGSCGRYAVALVNLCALISWNVHFNQRRTQTEGLDSARRNFKAGRNLDHVVLLRRGTPSQPTQWALLSQPYDDDDPSGTAIKLGPAPYGFGTYGLLYEGSKIG